METIITRKSRDSISSGKRDCGQSEANPLNPNDKQTQLHDVALVRAIAARDEGALAILYDRYNSILFGFLLHTLNNKDEAADILQEIFLRIWQQAADFDATRGCIFTWLVMMARSRAIDRLRAHNYQERTATNTSRETWQYPEGIIENSTRSEERKMVRYALEELQEEERRALWLVYFKGLSQPEIAAATGKPLDTVKTCMRTGLGQLRDLLHQKMTEKGVDQDQARAIKL